MIGYLKGTILAKRDGYVLVENNGVGYRLFTTPAVSMKESGSEVSLYTYLQVREDALNLYGFETPEDLSFFELLITVSGVGPKMALTILSAGETNLIKQAIANQDLAMFTNLGGVGKKTAERIVVELREKVDVLSSSDLPAGSDDLFFALENLGYSKKEIKDIVPKLDHSLSAEDKLRQALKLLSR